jgi:hypothetical protein
VLALTGRHSINPFFRNVFLTRLLGESACQGRFGPQLS